MRCLISGGCGYVGSRLVPHLLADGHKVTVYDAMYFGSGFLPKDNGHLRLIKGDIRDTAAWADACKGQEAVINLACISNDHSCQLDEAFSRAVNIDAFEPLVIAAKKAGVRRFIYCSSSSVYGISDAPEVTEEHSLLPVTLYNASKAECEKRLLPHQSPDFVCTIIRPATVCGYAPRMRFDLTVNIITAYAILKNEITVFGGEQKRPNLHIRDMIDCYRLLLEAPAGKIAGQIFNVGKQNMKVSEVAELVQSVVQHQFDRGPSIKTEPSTDVRSYHINSQKIERVLGFVPRYDVEHAIREICIKFKGGMWKDALENPAYTNVKQLVDRGFAVDDALSAFRKDRYA